MEAKRLTPKKETLRELFLKSGNLCAFPGCGHLMMDAQGVFIGQICHIEAAEYGGPRFNKAMTNEQRSHHSNLMLMCHAHHVITDDVKKFVVQKLQNMRTDHEKRFSDPSSEMTVRFVDQTTLQKSAQVKNLRRLDSVLKCGLDDEQRAENVEELNTFIQEFKLVPAEVRHFVGAVAQRAYRIRKTRAAKSGRRTEILVTDVMKVMKISHIKLRELIRELDAYNLGGLVIWKPKPG